MGNSLRTHRFRYTEWNDGQNKIVGRELYDHVTESGENRNCVDEEEYEDVVAELSDLLRTGWRGALPDS